MILVMDGRVQPHNLTQTGRDEKWLRGLLSVEDTYLASLDTQGRMLVQDRQGGVQTFEAMKPGEVTW